MQPFCFNKICKTKQLTPKYSGIKINGNNRQTKNTRRAATKKSNLYFVKKQKLN